MGETMIKASEEKDRKSENKSGFKSLTPEDLKELDRIDFLTLMAERRYM